WTRGGAPSGSISMQTEADAVLLTFRHRSWGETEWQSVKQRAPITWTACHLGGCRPWFRCTGYTAGRSCGRRVALLYLAGELCGCRRCYALAYASQQEAVHYRWLGKVQKIRMRLGGSPSMLEDFPPKPKGMHWQRYERMRDVHDLAHERAMMGLMQFADRLH